MYTKYTSVYVPILQVLWKKIDLQSPILSHALSPNDSFWALCNHVSPNDFLFQLDYQLPAGESTHMDNCLQTLEKGHVNRSREVISFTPK